jgi:hypothetical protein
MEAILMKRFGIIRTGVLLLLFGAAAPAYAQQDQHEKDAKPAKQEQQAKPEKQQEAKPQKQEQQAKPSRQEQQQQARGQNQQQAKGQQEQQQKQQQQARGQQQQQDKAAKQQEQRQAKGQQEQQQKQQARGQQQQQDKAAKQQEQQQARGQQDQQRQHAANRSPEEQHREAHEQQAAWQGDRAHSWKSEHRTWQQRGGYNGYRIPEERYSGYFGESHGFRIYSQPVVFVGGSPRFQYDGFWFGFVDPWPEYWSNDWYENDDVYVVYSDDGYYMYDRRYPGDRIAISVSLN